MYGIFVVVLSNQNQLSLFFEFLCLYFVAFYFHLIFTVTPNVKLFFKRMEKILKNFHVLLHINC